MNSNDKKRLVRRTTHITASISQLANLVTDPMEPYGDDNVALVVALHAARTAQQQLAALDALITERLTGRLDADEKVLTPEGVLAKVASSDSHSCKAAQKAQLVDAVDAVALTVARPGESDDAVRLRIRDECFGVTPRWGKIAERGIDPDRFRTTSIKSKIELS